MEAAYSYQKTTKIISKTFPPFMLDGKELKFVTEFNIWDILYCLTRVMMLTLKELICWHRRSLV